MRLRDLAAGVTEEIPVALEHDAILPVVPESNPATVTAENLARLLHDAWEGADLR